MNKVLVKNNQYYVVKTTEATPQFLVRENRNTNLAELPTWNYYLSTNPARAIKCEDQFIADVMLNDYKNQIRNDIEARYGMHVTFDDSMFKIVPMVISYQIGADE